ncbi:hypothetical protein NP493_98g05043 [Ridgeia piscesae]|uniref:Uncharacterized protein n=1 Tax=Ridgeia piscesae TaxID=27915 RepID=A0AAD9P7S5_RIDPI|nr:hypothetical protein NP493_98g05043 [Ridgeia piscesae]
MTGGEQVLDLDDRVRMWADQMGGSNGRNSAYYVDWSRVNVTTEKPLYDVRATTSAPHSATLFKSRFENNSSGEQEHTFSAQSKYTSSSSVSLHQSDEAFGQKLCVTSAGAQTSEKEQSWNVNTKIVVPARETITAQQTVQEVTYSAHFSVVTVISGKVHVTKRSANGSEVFFEPKKIADILVAFQRLPAFVTVVNDTIRVTNTGTCELTYGVEQYVTVSSSRR